MPNTTLRLVCSARLGRYIANNTLWPALAVCLALLWAGGAGAVARVAPQAYFEPNRGQAVDGVRFLVRGAQQAELLDDGFRLAGVSFRWRGALPGGGWLPQEPGAGKVNYYRGRAQWLSGLPTYGRLRRPQLYPGIDLVYRFDRQQRLEYDLVLAPGADPARLRLRVAGAGALRIDEQGYLLARGPEGVVRQHPPRVWQRTGGRMREIEARFVLLDGGEVGFRLAGYDRNQALLIDPVVDFSSYLGGASRDNVHALAWSADGRLLVAGTTATRVRIAPDGQVSVEDSGFPRAGFTPPSEPGAQGNCGYGYDEAQGRGGEQVLLRYDGFLTKLDPATGQIIFSTYFGGCGNDTVRGIALDAAGNIYLTGTTLSADFPVTAGRQVLSLGNTAKADAFVAKFDADGQLVYSRYLGGSGDDFGRAVAVDQRGFAYVVGITASSDFDGNRCNQGSGWRCLAGGSDVFVARLWSTGETVDYMNYFGGQGDDYGTAIALADDADPAQVGIFVAGSTASADFPVSPGAYSGYQPGAGACGAGSVPGAESACSDALLMRLTERGKTLAMSLVFGGARDDAAVDLALTPAGNPVVVGVTHSAGVVLDDNGAIDPALPENASLLQRFPLYRPLRDGAGQSDRLGDTGSAEAFVSEFSADGQRLLFSSFLRGSDTDVATSVTVSPEDAIYLAGRSRSGDFFPIVRAFQNTAAGEDVFVAKLDAQRQPVYATLLGAENLDGANALALKQELVDGRLVDTLALGGNTFSSDFPVLGSVQAAAGGGDSDGFVLTLSEPAQDPAVDLKVALSLARDSVRVGDSVDLIATVSNQGAAEAVNTRLWLMFPAGVDVRASGGSCIKKALSLFCQVGDLTAAGAGGDSLQVRLDVLARFAGDIELVASARALAHDGNLADNTVRQRLAVIDNGRRSGALGPLALLLLVFVLAYRGRRPCALKPRL